MYCIEELRSENSVWRKGLVELTIEVLNVILTTVNGTTECNIQYQVFRHHPLKVEGAVLELLHQGDDMEPIIQQFTDLLILEMVLAHGKNISDINW